MKYVKKQSNFKQNGNNKRHIISPRSRPWRIWVRSPWDFAPSTRRICATGRRTCSGASRRLCLCEWIWCWDRWDRRSSGPAPARSSPTDWLPFLGTTGDRSAGLSARLSVFSSGISPSFWWRLLGPWKRIFYDIWDNTTLYGCTKNPIPLSFPRKLGKECFLDDVAPRMVERGSKMVRVVL